MNSDLYNKARNAHQNGQKREAIQLYKQALMENPQNAPAWYGLSQLIDDPARKRECLERVLRLEPNHPGALQKLEMLDLPDNRPIAREFFHSASPQLSPASPSSPAPQHQTSNQMAPSTNWEHYPLQNSLPVQQYSTPPGVQLQPQSMPGTARFCTTCGAALISGQRFCGGCGSPTIPAPVLVPPPAPYIESPQQPQNIPQPEEPVQNQATGEKTIGAFKAFWIFLGIINLLGMILSLVFIAMLLSGDMEDSTGFMLFGNAVIIFLSPVFLRKTNITRSNAMGGMIWAILVSVIGGKILGFGGGDSETYVGPYLFNIAGWDQFMILLVVGLIAGVLGVLVFIKKPVQEENDVAPVYPSYPQVNSQPVPQPIHTQTSKFEPSSEDQPVVDKLSRKTGSILGIVLFLIAIIAIVSILSRPREPEIGWCQELDCSKLSIHSVEQCSLLPVQINNGITEMYILHANQITSNGTEGIPESIIATKHTYEWYFNETTYEPNLTCADFQH